MIYKIGIDIGNVLTQKDTDIHPFGEDYLRVRSCDGAFESVGILGELVGPSHIYIVSKCSRENQWKSLDWLKKTHFFALTGVPQEHVFFCLHRSDKRKIAKDLQLTHFIDDRWTVLRHLVTLDSIQGMYLFRPVHDEKESFMKNYTGKRIIIIDSWPQLVNDFRSRYIKEISI